MTDFVFDSAVQGLASTGSWSTNANSLYFKGEQVVLHGFSTSCTPYLLQKLSINGGKTVCWADYNFDDPENVITELNEEQASAAIEYLTQVTGPGVMPTLRVPLTASAWLGIETDCTADAWAKYPNLGQQYRTLIQNLVTRFTQ